MHFVKPGNPSGMNGLAVLEAGEFKGKCYDMSRYRHIALMTLPGGRTESCLPIESSGFRADLLEITPFFSATIVKSMSQTRNLCCPVPLWKFCRGNVEQSKAFHGWRRC